MIEQIRKIREAGHVERCHTVPHIGSYNVAMHSWHAAMILVELWPEASRNLIMQVLWHDAAERWTGDIPATAKWQFPGLKEASDNAEKNCFHRLNFPLVNLTEEEELWLHAVDGLELYLWCLDQEAFGNQHIKTMKENIFDWVDDNTSQIPLPVLKIFQNYKWHRSADLLETNNNEA